MKPGNLPQMNRACRDCPWQVANHGRRSEHGFFTVANRRRLWNGIRTGAAPGMTCHGTDTARDREDWGETAGEGATHECAGALAVVQRELLIFQNIAQGIDAVGAAKTGLALTVYRKLRRGGMTRGGLAHWVMRVTGMDPFAGAVAQPTEAFIDQPVGNGLPWDGAAVTLPQAREAGEAAARADRRG